MSNCIVNNQRKTGMMMDIHMTRNCNAHLELWYRYKKKKYYVIVGFAKLINSAVTMAKI